MLKLSGYTAVLKDFKEFNASGDWIAIQEDLKKESSSSIILLDKKNTNMGTVLKISDKARKDSGISVGDSVLFAEWQGGKWSFQDGTSPTNEVKVIIMELRDVLAAIRKD